MEDCPVLSLLCSLGTVRRRAWRRVAAEPRSPVRALGVVVFVLRGHRLLEMDVPGAYWGRLWGPIRGGRAGEGAGSGLAVQLLGGLSGSTGTVDEKAFYHSIYLLIYYFL